MLALHETLKVVLDGVDGGRRESKMSEMKRLRQLEGRYRGL